MKEFNVTCEAEDVNYLNYIKANLNNCEVVTILNNTLSVCCENENIKIVKKQLKTLISEIIVLIYKEKFFKQNLVINNLSSEYREALIKCLVMFDYEDDVSFVMQKLEIDYNLILQSFYIFKLKNLVNKWEEIKNIASFDGINLNTQSVLELIKFLVDVITPKRKVVNIFFNGETFVIKDEYNMIIKLNSNLNNNSREVSLITTLISLSPKTINLHCISCISENTFQILYYIFDKKINLLV